MLLFIGVEVLSPGSTSGKKALVAADRNESLQTRLHSAMAKPATRRSPAGAVRPGAGTPPPAGDSRSKTLPGNSNGPAQSDTDSAEPQVVLGPELEPDPVSADSEPALSGQASDHRIPAVAAHTRPKARLLPDIEPLPPSDSRTSAAIEERLAGIQINLDKIGRTLDAQALRDQAPRDPPVDAVKQVTELLRQFHEARQSDLPTSQLQEPAAREPADDKQDSANAEEKSASLPPDAAHDVPPRKAEADEAERNPRPVTRIYRPRYLSGSALQSLVEPLLTRDLGKSGAADAETAESGTGRDGSPSGSPGNALVVHDLPQVMRKIDQLIAKLDVPPIQVTLEVVVVTVNAALPQGIDLLTFNAPGQTFAVSPIDSGTRPVATGGLPLTSEFGLKSGVLTGDPQAFIRALEAAAPFRNDGARSARAWQMTVANRQAALLMLDDPFGPDGSGNQSAAGTILKIRPIVDRTGGVRLDVRRETDLDAPAAGNRAAALTNQIPLETGQTAVLGGFFEEQTALQIYHTSRFGQLPVVGGLFRKQAEVIDRCETIVLLTPHVAAGSEADSQFVREQRPASITTGTEPTIQASHAEAATSPGEAERAPAPPPPKPRGRPRLKP